MSAFVAAVLVLLAVAAVLYPLLRRGTRLPALVQDPGHLRELMDRRDTLLTSLRELEFDRRLGNLDQEQYRTLRLDYERRVAAVLKALDARANGLARALEEEVLLLRRGKPNGMACQQCGSMLETGPTLESPCPQCGFGGPQPG